MKIDEARKIARKKLFLAICGLPPSLFVAIVTGLKNIEYLIRDLPVIDNSLSNFFRLIIEWIYDSTKDHIGFFWRYVWGELPIVNQYNIFSKENLIFLLIMVATLYFWVQLQDHYWYKNKIHSAIRKSEENELERDAEEERGYRKESNSDTLNINVTTSSPDPWFKRPIGMIFIGLTVTILGKILWSISGSTGV